MERLHAKLQGGVSIQDVGGELILPYVLPTLLGVFSLLSAHLLERDINFSQFDAAGVHLAPISMRI